MRVLVKAFCYVGYYAFATYLPESGWIGGSLWNAIRVFFARGLLRECGKHVHIDRRVNFGSGSTVSFKDYSGIGANCRLIGDITFEPYASTSFGIFITAYARNLSRTDIPMNQQGKLPDDPVVLGRDTVLFANCIILPGVKVGESSVIGAGAVVTRSVPPYCFAAGNPAKVVKWRKAPGPEAFQRGMLEIGCKIPDESLPHYEAAQQQRQAR